MESHLRDDLGEHPILTGLKFGVGFAVGKGIVNLLFPSPSPEPQVLVVNAPEPLPPPDYSTVSEDLDLDSVNPSRCLTRDRLNAWWISRRKRIKDQLDAGVLPSRYGIDPIDGNDYLTKETHRIAYEQDLRIYAAVDMGMTTFKARSHLGYWLRFNLPDDYKDRIRQLPYRDPAPLYDKRRVGNPPQPIRLLSGEELCQTYNIMWREDLAA